MTAQWRSYKEDLDLLHKKGRRPRVPGWHSYWNEIPYQIRDRRYVYRGQANSSWQLVPSLFRQDGRYLTKTERQDALSEFLVRKLEDFKIAYMRFHRLEQFAFSDYTFEDWCALAQHQGYRTPLLDWTDSPLVGLFMGYFYRDSSCGNSPVRIFRIDSEALPDEVRILRPVQLWRNSRHYVQQGAFTLCMDAQGKKSVGAINLDDVVHTSPDEFVEYVDLDASERNTKDVLSLLRQCNLSGSHLFPDSFHHTIREVDV